ncbi:MAG: glycoside hydrolase family 3 C-terminal domain-containing protein [Rikenellaceae bacterium]
MKRVKLTLCTAVLSLLAVNLSAQEYQFPFQNPELTLEQRVDDLVARMTLEEKISQMHNQSPAIDRLGVCAYDWWNEALHGVARVRKSYKVTVYPQAIGMAASFNPDLLEVVASSISDEGRAIFNQDIREGKKAVRYRGLTYWTPNINIFRDPRWGRGQETYGEDPYLAAAMGSAMVRGLQGDDEFFLKSSACAKHYAVHSGPEYNRHVYDARPTKYDLWDTYLPAFKVLVKDADVSGVMCAYNRYMGAPCCGDPVLMVDILREQWGFDGYVTSDCWGIDDFYKHHKTHETPASASAAATLAGTDLECGTANKNLLQAVEENLILERQIHKSVKRLFEIRMRLGMFDPLESNPYGSIGLDVLDCDKHKALALDMAHESMVLLKNAKNTLPLNQKKIKRIAVIGPNAKNEAVMMGNYFGYPSHTSTVVEGIENNFKDAEVIYIEGVGHIAALEGVDFKDVAAQAKKADVIIYVGGISADYEGEEKGDGFGTADGFSRGDRNTIELPAAQKELLKVLDKTGKPLIFVNMSGSVVAMEWEHQNVDAIIQAWYGGQAGGQAIADIISGDYNPSGRMPLTAYKSDADLPDFEDYSMTNRTYRYFQGEARYPFGYGLSYTTFAYDNISAPTVINAGDKITVTAQVTNSGKMDGDEAVQLYVVHKNRDVLTPNCALKGVKKINLKVGESKSVEFTLNPQDFAIVDERGNTIVSAGDVEIHIGGGQPNHAATVSVAAKIEGDPYQIQ